jgi:hypothetical protein
MPQMAPGGGFLGSLGSALGGSDGGGQHFTAGLSAYTPNPGGPMQFHRSAAFQNALSDEPQGGGLAAILTKLGLLR